MSKTKLIELYNGKLNEVQTLINDLKDEMVMGDLSYNEYIKSMTTLDTRRLLYKEFIDNLEDLK